MIHDLTILFINIIDEDQSSNFSNWNAAPDEHIFAILFKNNLQIFLRSVWSSVWLSLYFNEK